MVKVEFLGPINKDDLSLDVKTIEELSNILKQDVSLVSWLESCAVAVNDTLINDKSFELKSGDRVSLLPPVCGG